jgi:hypothetical protein
MEILDNELKAELSIENEEVKIIPLEDRVIYPEEMPKIIDVFFKKLESIRINNVSLISKAFNDTIIIDPKLTIDIINQSLGIKENDLFHFIYNMYFYNQDALLKEAIGEYRFIQIPALSFNQIGDNRFQLDY